MSAIVTDEQLEETRVWLESIRDVPDLPPAMRLQYGVGRLLALCDTISALRTDAQPVAFMVLLHVRRGGTANVPYTFYYGLRETAELEARRKRETIPDASFTEIVPLYAGAAPREPLTDEHLRALGEAVKEIEWFAGRTEPDLRQTHRLATAALAILGGER